MKDQYKTESLEVRPAVAAFAQIMEEKLRKHDGDYGPEGWRAASLRRLQHLLQEELDELQRSLQNHDLLAVDVARECADVANFAMMIADVCGGLPRGSNQ